jgi:selenocysteine lyase/cysteine desulfurase
MPNVHSRQAWRQHAQEDLFSAVRRGVIGEGRYIKTPYGLKPLIYADWCASGRLYAPIEAYMTESVGPWIGNTHTDSNATGASMTQAYSNSIRTIKRHVNAGKSDVIFFSGTGMTGAVNKLQRLLNLRVPEALQDRVRLTQEERPVIFITHMEHHSNHISWLETMGEVVIVPPDDRGLVSPAMLEWMLKQYPDRPYKIGAFTACSNVTGIEAPLGALARVMHQHMGLIFVDYSASAPYSDINMHPADPLEKLDAIYFSPHKFLGGPGTSGVLIADSRLLCNNTPDEPGGGTVIWTDPWGKRQYIKQTEEREDGGTPGFLQAIRTALCIKLKEEMGVERMRDKEKELLKELWPLLDRIPRLRLLEDRNRERLPIVSFILAGLHYKMVVRLLNDRFGIQARGGCSCAGSYGHYLFGIGPDISDHIYEQINAGNLEWKPGWVRISLHPVMNKSDVQAIGAALEEIALYGEEWSKDYDYEASTGALTHKSGVHTSVFGAGTEKLDASWENLFKQSLQSIHLEDVNRCVIEGDPALVSHVAQLS